MKSALAVKVSVITFSLLIVSLSSGALAQERPGDPAIYDPPSSGSRIQVRIESVLLDLTKNSKYSPIAWKPAFATVTQRELGESLGVSEETICRELKAMRPVVKAQLIKVGSRAS
jgi:hypothetical protein